MRKCSLGAAAITLLSCTPLLAQQDCKAIPDATARLACFDKPAPAKPAVQVKPPAAKPVAASKRPNVTAVDGGWELRVIKDGFSDKVNCVISPATRPWVQISVGHLYISYQGRGGVEGYTVRTDDNPAGLMQLPTPIDKSVGTVHFKDAAFYDIMAANRLRVQTFTVLRELKDEDLDLVPAKRLYKKMGPECEK
jgi:hypothetical protein